MWLWKQSLVMVWVLMIVGGTPPQPFPTAPSPCPQQCHCLTTPDGLHKAVCNNLHTLYKYSVHHKSHNINIIDLHNAQITQVNGELDKFTEVVTVDFSKNKITQLDKFLRNSKKLVHLNLSNNQLKKFSASQIPHSVSSLDLSYNLLHNMPTDLQTLTDLEHLLLEGNPLHCSCDNLKLLNHLKELNVLLDDVMCSSPEDFKGVIWNKMDMNGTCNDSQQTNKEKNPSMDDVMMGDQPSDDDTTIDNDIDNLDAVKHWESDDKTIDNDDENFITVSRSEKPNFESDNFGGSGDFGTDKDLMSKTHEEMQQHPEHTSESSTEDPEMSGDIGSGLGSINMRSDNNSNAALYDEDYGSGDDDMETTTTSTTTTEFPFFGLLPHFGDFDHFESTSKEPFEEPKIFQGNIDWDKDDEITTVFEKDIDKIYKPDISESPSTPAVVLMNQDYMEEESRQTAKSSVGTYVCIGILIAILVGLIGLAVLKSQIRKRNDRRLMRHEKKDVEKAGKEMVDMNKALLGKPINNTNDKEKKVNGNYELVPTHETKKKPENGTIDSKKGVEDNIKKAEAPKVMAENPNNNVPSTTPSRENPKINIPETNDHSNVDGPIDNGINHDHGQSNGFHYPESNFLAPEYTPVYNPDSGRVRIKLTETPKPKTPTLVTRSRSNAGDIIITPASEQNSPAKSTT